MTQDLKAESYEQLLQRFLSSIRLIVRNRNVNDAECLIADIQTEWQRRRASGDAIRDYDRPEQGLLGALGYHVGHSQGQPTETRRLILKFLVEGELPMIHSANYMAEWGEPRSLMRLEKLVRVLENLMEGNRTKPNSKLAVIPNPWNRDSSMIHKSAGL